MKRYTNLKPSFYGPAGRILTVSAILILLGIISGALLPKANLANSRTFLSRLITSQASILAIVFSVTVIAIQLVSSRYSSRLWMLFIDSPVFFVTFLIFILSLSVDFILVYNIPQTPTRIFTIGVFISAAFGAASLFSLLVFVRTVIHRSTPDGLIERYKAHMSPEQYRKEIREHIEDGQIRVHPMQPLYSTVMEALSNNERTTASNALDAYSDIIMTVLQDCIDQGEFTNNPTEFQNTLFGPVLKDQLPEIAVKAEREDETDITDSAVRTQYDIGRTAIESGAELPAQQAWWGINQTLLESGELLENGKYQACYQGWEHLAKLLTDTAEHSTISVVKYRWGGISHKVRTSLLHAENPDMLRVPFARLFNALGTAHKELLKSHFDLLSEFDCDWRSGAVSGSGIDEEIEAASDLRKSIFETTEHFLRYYIEEGDFPVSMGTFRSHWKSIVSEGTKVENETYGIALCWALIEIAFITSAEDPENLRTWSGAFARIRNDGNPEVVDTAFDTMLSEYPGPNDGGILQSLSSKESGESFEAYRNMLTLYTDEYQPLNAHEEYPDLVETLQGRSHSRWCEIRDTEP
jgi:hypothetical protein